LIGENKRVSLTESVTALPSGHEIGDLSMRTVFSQILLVAAVLLPLNASAEELIKEFRGSRSTSTLEFEVRAPWVLDWRLSGDPSSVSAVDVSLFDAGTGVHEGVVLRSKKPGNGVRLFDKSGEFYFRIDTALLDWTLKVIQLTEEEAKAYQPISSNILDRQ
jgi:hypothetical protein